MDERRIVLGNKLKGCPFCGGMAHMEFTSDFHGSGGFYALVLFVEHIKPCFLQNYVREVNCGYMTIDVRRHPELLQFVADDVERAWNKRVEDAQAT